MADLPLTGIESLTRQLTELDKLVADGVLTGEASRAARDSIERELVDAVRARGVPTSGAAASAADTSGASTRPSRPLLLGAASFVVVLAVLGYGWGGGYERLAPERPSDSARSAAGAADHSGADRIDPMLARLAGRLSARPDDAEGWALLARSYAARSRFDEAVPALKKVSELRPDDAQALADYADGLASSRGGNLAGEPEKLVTRALALDPRNGKALALSGTIAFDRADFAAAIARWDEALAAIEPGTDFARQLQGAVAEARERAAPAAVAAADSGGATSAPPDERKSAGNSITGRVSLAAPLRSAVAADDVVFVYARADSGSKMPLAILRKRGADLPFDFTLDDSSAMSPTARLSSFRRIVVIARVSKSGSAAALPGDLRSTGASVSLGAQDLQIEISETVR